jgi:hypothetical protein
MSTYYCRRDNHTIDCGRDNHTIVRVYPIRFYARCSRPLGVRVRRYGTLGALYFVPCKGRSAYTPFAFPLPFEFP